jgi:nitric oxide reductase NorE protein
MREAAPRALNAPPGGLLMWLIVTLELVTFAMVTLFIAHLRSSEPLLFAQGQRTLDTDLGLGLTVCLLTSGWLAAEAVHAFRAGLAQRARRGFLAAAVVGLGFVALKLGDFAHKVGAGHVLGVDDFWDAYLLATGFHFLHVCVGLLLLAWAARRVGAAAPGDEESGIVGAALFWHLCDVAWCVLFPLFFVRV